MALMLFFGCIFVAFGTGAVIFFKLVFNKAQLVLVFISAAFVWLLALTLASLIWYIIAPLHEAYWFYVPMNVLVQEAFRLVFFRLYDSSERGFSVISTNAVVFPLTDLMSSLSAGLGFGLMQALMLYGSIVANSNGAGTYFSPQCPQMSIFVLSAWNAWCFILLHIAWMIFAFDGYRRADWVRVTVVAFSHLCAALVTLLNRRDDGCAFSLALLFAQVLINAGGAYWVMHQPGYRSKKD